MCAHVTSHTLQLDPVSYENFKLGKLIRGFAGPETFEVYWPAPLNKLKPFFDCYYIVVENK